MNKYLVTRSGRFVGTRTAASLTFFGPLVGSFVLGGVGIGVGSALDSGAIAALSMLLAFALFIGAVVSQWVFLIGGGNDAKRATEAIIMAGDGATAIALCHKPLGRVFRADVRTRALFVLGLVAESNCDFAEAADLFERASAMIPAFAAGKWQRHARVLILSHRALALVATGRLQEADAAVRMASALFPPRAPGAFDALTDDAAFGSIGVAAALRDLEPGRDPRALLTLASIVFLAAAGMGREAVELSQREAQGLTFALMPRERALVALVEARARGQLGGGPMRAPGAAPPNVDPASAAWAERVLPQAR
jgi:hypothetical protein